MMWRYDERFPPGSQPFFYGCSGFVLLVVLQVVGCGLGPAGVAAAVALTLIAGAIMTLWLGAIVAWGASGQIGSLHVILGFTGTGRRFLWPLAFIPFPMLLMEYEILHSKLGSNAFVDVTGWTMSPQVVMYTMGLFTLAWLFGVVLLWYQVKAMRNKHDPVLPAVWPRSRLHHSGALPGMWQNPVVVGPEALSVRVQARLLCQGMFPEKHDRECAQGRTE